MRLTSLRESSVLRQETVPRMDQIDTLVLGQINNPIDIQIRGNRPLPLTHAVRLVSLETVNPETILIRINGDSAATELGRATKDSDSNFTAISDK